MAQFLIGLGLIALSGVLYVFAGTFEQLLTKNKK